MQALSVMRIVAERKGNPFVFCCCFLDERFVLITAVRSVWAHDWLCIFLMWWETPIPQSTAQDIPQIVTSLTTTLARACTARALSRLSIPCGRTSAFVSSSCVESRCLAEGQHVLSWIHLNASTRITKFWCWLSYICQFRSSAENIWQSGSFEILI